RVRRGRPEYATVAAGRKKNDKERRNRMRIGVPKEITPGERRVATTPEVVGHLAKLGFSVVVETGAGAEASFSDDAYVAVGAEVASNAGAVWSEGDIVLKVRAPSGAGIDWRRRG